MRSYGEDNTGYWLEIKDKLNTLPLEVLKNIREEFKEPYEYGLSRVNDEFQITEFQRKWIEEIERLIELLKINDYNTKQEFVYTTGCDISYENEKIIITPTTDVIVIDNQEIKNQFLDKLNETLKGLNFRINEINERAVVYFRGTSEIYERVDEAIKKRIYESATKTPQNISQEMFNISQEPNTVKRFKRGELRKRLEKIIEEMNLKPNNTIASTKINLIVRKITNEGYYTNDDIIRAKFSKLGYSTERKED